LFVKKQKNKQEHQSLKFASVLIQLWMCSNNDELDQI